jgi:Mn-dependent DtxR family transcriptional regulator
MLGVRRVGITAAAGALQRDGLIEYRRGELIVLSRRGLEAAACGCYAADQRSYSTLLH